MYISERVQQTAAPIITDLAAVAAERTATGGDLLNLGQGIADFPPPPAALAAARAALDDPTTHRYSLDAGLLELRAAIARKWARDAGTVVDPEREIIVTAGGNQAAVLALLTCTDIGDEVLLPAPYYFNHEMAVHLCGLRVVEAPLAPVDGFALGWERLAPYVTARTRAVLLPNPGNPTGAVAGAAALATCARELAARNITLIVDETYEYFIFEPARHYSPAADPALRPHVITISSFSKGFCLAGWRVGYVLLPPDLWRAALKVQDTLVICAPVISQRAVAATLDSDYYPLLAAQRAELATRRAALHTGLAGIPRLTWHETYGAMYAFVGVADSPPVADLVPDLIREIGVLVLPGTTFGPAGAGHLRLSYGAAPVPVLVEALARLGAYFSRQSSVVSRQ